MKVVGLLLAALVLCTSVAAGGSNALAADVTSPAFDQCLRAPSTTGPCRPAVRVVAGAEEFGAGAGDAIGGVDAREGNGQNLSSPEWWQEVVAAGVRAFLVEFARQAADSLIGGAQSQSDAEAAIPPDLFDPAR